MQAPPQERDLGKLDMFVARAGDVVTIMTPGGGGFGDPLERPAAQVRDDVLSGYISQEAAERDYGVVLADRAVDEVATQARRATIRATRPPLRRFDFGPERDAWDAVFDDASMLELNALLLQLGPSVCSRLRREMFERVVPGIGIRRQALAGCHRRYRRGPCAPCP